MTKWIASVGEILDTSADALICSANPWLNLSGGVGGAFGIRHGTGMQEYLHNWLAQRKQRFVRPGDIVVGPSFGSQFKLIIHAVAIDAFYDTSPEIICHAYENSFTALADSGCRTVVAACLACGYGRVSPQKFVAAASSFFERTLQNIDRVDFVSTDSELIGAIQGEINTRAR